jgi:hypothetical protein
MPEVQPVCYGRSDQGASGEAQRMSDGVLALGVILCVVGIVSCVVGLAEILAAKRIRRDAAEMFRKDEGE